MNEVAILESGSQSMLPASANGAQELFVINLCASMTPMPAVPKNLTGFEKYKLYQVSRQEDGRRRFRLRLGFFTSEADAEWVLNSVRGLYPAAFTGCVTNEDLRYVGDTLPAAQVAATDAPKSVAMPVAAAKPVVEQPVIAPSPSVASAPAKAVVTKPATVAAPTTAPKVAAPVATAAPAKAASKPEQPAKPAVALTASTPAVTPQPAADAKSHDQPFHVGRGIDLPDIDLELTDEYEALSLPVKPTLAPSAPQVRQPTAVAARTGSATTSAINGHAAANKPAIEAPIRSASIISPPKIVDDYVPILDTTLTIRTLTKTEAEDPNRPKWFAVQLALSEQPINLDTMPKLDIFAAYTLYSVATMEGGTVKHALRLGFFRESVSAEAVMGYLKAFFNQPTINQISAAEFDRFGDSKPKPVAQPDGKVVNLEAKRPGGPVKPLAPIAVQQPAVKPISKPIATSTARIAPPARPQSFLSRLIGRQLD